MFKFFIDIETVPLVQNFDELSDNLKELWAKKAAKDPSLTWESAGLFAEFGRIACISLSYEKDGNLNTKSYADFNELEILVSFVKDLLKIKQPLLFVGHNILNFDLPFIARRFFANGLDLPHIFRQMQGQKEWNINHIDTMRLWRFGDFGFVSLALLCETLGVPSPKSELDGAGVFHTFYIERDLQKIVRYCEADVAATFAVYEKLSK